VFTLIRPDRKREFEKDHGPGERFETEICQGDDLFETENLELWPESASAT